VPGVAGNVKAAALIVHAAVTVIVAVRFAVVVPACAIDTAHSHSSGATTAPVRRIEAKYSTACFVAIRKNRCIRAPRTTKLNHCFQRTIPRRN
jgi:hypothetical protein